MDLTAVLAAEHPNTIQFRQLAIELIHETAQLTHLLALPELDRQLLYERRAMHRLRRREIEHIVHLRLSQQAQEAVN